MANLVSSDQRDWRYLSEPGDGNGQFSQFLRRLGVDLSELSGKLSLQELVRLGWLQPRLHLRLPPAYFYTWTNYPLWNREGAVPPECHWAEMVYAAERDPIPAYAHPDQPFHPRWYEHPLDDRTDADIPAVWEHASTAEQIHNPPEPIEHRGVKIRPWRSYFAYWQAYQILDLVHASHLFAPLPATPEAREQLEQVLVHFDKYEAFARANIDRAMREWREREPTFEWLSRYRTIVGWWVYHRLPDDSLHSAARALASEHRLTRDRLCEDIRDCLLTLWQDWTWMHRPSDIPTPVRELLREDILRAIEFLSITTGEPVDQDDPFWDPDDRQPRRWARLKDVLPFETINAKRDLPRTAPYYLTDVNPLLPAAHRLTTEHLKEWTDQWWTSVPPFQRFCLNVARLHRDYIPPTSETRVILRALTPIDYFLLTAGSAERVLLHQYLAAHGTSKDAPGFTPLLLWAGDQLTTTLSLPPIRNQVAGFLPRTKLVDLPRTRRNPFSTKAGLPKNDLCERLIAACHDFAVMRHYAAHHDAIDDELIAQAWGREPLEALLFITLLTLRATT